MPDTTGLAGASSVRTAGEGSAKSRQLGPGGRGAGGSGSLPCRQAPGVVNPKTKTSPRCAAVRPQRGAGRFVRVTWERWPFATAEPPYRRSEEGRGGKGCVSRCRSGRSTYQKKKKNTDQKK